MKRHIFVVYTLLSSVYQTTMPLVLAKLNDPARVAVDESDRRVDVALRLFEKSDPAAGEAELRQVAQEYPACAQAHFYLGVLSQNRGESERAVGFYVKALHAGDCSSPDLLASIGWLCSVNVVNGARFSHCR